MGWRVLAGFLLAATPSLALEGSGEPWGARDPGSCSGLRQEMPPGVDQITALVRCTHEVALESGGELWLMQNVQAAITEEVPFTTMYFEYALEDADVAAATYRIAGSFTWAVCMTKEDAATAGVDLARNCRESDVPEANGVCWRTDQSDWRCLLTGAIVGTRTQTVPPQ